jgi:Leucine-rich repeat (LRR) protein
MLLLHLSSHPSSIMGFRGFCLFVFALMDLSFNPWLLKSEKLTCNSIDLRALTGFYNCVDSEIAGTWNKTASPDCCSWTGVICDSSTVSGTRVVGLELGSKRLTGKICGSLAELYHLRVLNLSYNFLSGSLPAELFKLQNLEVIDVSNNDFSGSINRGMCRTSTGIQVLNFSNNHFSGEVPKDLANCTSLQYLSFDKNSLSGSLPESIFQLQDLRELNLQDNSICGPLTNGFGNLSNLVKLDISSNIFSGDLPDVFGSLTRLEHFSANTNLFTGRLPTSLVNSPSLQMLYLNNNSLSGSINLNCSAMKNLVSLGLGSNLFHGPIPNSLSFCQRLTELNLARNSLNSELPNDFKNLQALTYLSITSLVNISSTLGILQHCRNLSILVLSANFHDEEIPDNVNMQFNNLKGLALANCKLRGSIPQWLSSCHKLQLLDLSWNHLGGTIPSWFGEFESLFYLDLSNNSFEGEIPRSLTLLQTLISGNISLEEPFSSFHLSIVREGVGRGLTYKQLSAFPPTLDLSYNMLQGPIWPGFGNLKRLHVFILKYNNLSGPIPDNLSGMSNVEVIDLSHNKLSGEIPLYMGNLSFLSAFNVSYNQLCGEIPKAVQFDTFPDTCFVGNIGLCRALCTCEPEQPPTHSFREKKMKIVGLPFGIGAATSFVLTVTGCFMSGWVLSKPKKRKNTVTRIGH